MSASNSLENDLLDLLFNATAIPDLADNDATSPAANLYLSLHTGDPGEAGSQTTSECTYGSYARVAVARTSSGFTVSGSSVVLAANQDFPAATSGSETATHFGVGTGSSGAGYLMFSGAISPNIAISTGVTPRLTSGTQITAD